MVLRRFGADCKPAIGRCRGFVWLGITPLRVGEHRSRLRAPSVAGSLPDRLAAETYGMAGCLIEREFARRPG